MKDSCHFESRIDSLPTKRKFNHVWLRRYSKFVCFCVVLLIFKGALVTSNDAGLSVPDWPTSYGDNMFLFPPSKWIGPIFFEHVHRLLASFVGVLTVILTAWICWVENRKWVKILSICALGTVVTQGVLGGLTVLFQLPTAVSSAHAVLAQTFFIITIVIAYSQSTELAGRMGERKIDPSAYRVSLLFCSMVYLQLIIGAVMRHSEAGLAVLDFPTVGGQLLPTFDVNMMSAVNALRQQADMASVGTFQVFIHLMHRFGALCVVLFFIPVYINVLIRGRLTNISSKAKSTTIAISFLITCQFLMGILTVLTVRNTWIASFHVAIGALLLGFSVLLVLRAKSIAKL